MASRATRTALLMTLAVGLSGAVPVDLCVEPSFEAAVAVMRLDEHSPGFDLRPVRPNACDAGDGYRARFRRRGEGIALVLWTPTGDRLERSVPWIDRPEDAVIDLSRQGRLGAVAILLSGLVLEDRALRAVAPRSPALASEAPVAPMPVPVPVPVPASPEAAPPIAPPVPPVSPPSDSRARRDSPRRSARSRRSASRAGTMESGTTGAAATTAARALANAGPPDEPNPRAAPPPEPPPFGADRESGGPGITVIAPVPTPASAVGSSTGDAAPRIGVGVGAALRAPSVLGLEAALRVEAWGLLLEVGGLPPIVWDLDGRPLELSSAWTAFGWVPRLYSRPAIEVDGRLALVVERATVLRLELPDAMTRVIWDAGVDVAATISGPMSDGWRIGGMLGGRWLATANDIRIPDGPRTALNAWQWRLGLAVDWAP